jgi:hypothetical protein
MDPEPEIRAAALSRKAFPARTFLGWTYSFQNLGRAYLAKEMYGQALRCFERALVR